MMLNMNRRSFIKNTGVYLLGSLVFPKVSLGKKLDKNLIKKILEPYLDDLTKKIIQIESNWGYWKQRKDTKATGLMQITPITLKEWNLYGEGIQYNLYDLFDPYKNIQVGKWYLHQRIGEHYLPFYGLKNHNENLAASYNAGPVRIGKIGDALENFDKLPQQTKDYLKKLWALS